MATVRGKSLTQKQKGLKNTGPSKTLERGSIKGQVRKWVCIILYVEEGRNPVLKGMKVSPGKSAGQKSKKLGPKQSRVRQKKKNAGREKKKG